MMKKLIVTLLLALFAATASGQVPMSTRQKDEFLNDLVKSFEDEFLWKEKGNEIARALRRKIENGAYASIPEADVFVETLNRDLFQLSNDLHLSIDLYQEKPKAEKSRPTPSKKKVWAQKEQIDNRISYLKIDEFPRLNPDLKAEIKATMTSLGKPQHLILDLRDNSGGSDNTINHLAGYFFQEKTKLAISYSWGAEPKEVWAIPKDVSSNFADTQLIILTSQATFSAGEIFTQRLQQHQRATVIGEATPGAAHRTATYLMSDIFLLNWPYEKSEHALTGQDLEGIGIQPEHEVHYNKAKEVAILLASASKSIEITFVENGQDKKLPEALMKALNSKSEESLQRFVSKYVHSANERQVLSTLRRYKKVWNEKLQAKILNTHYLPGNSKRLFIESDFGTKQFKINLNQQGKIESLMMR